MADALKFDDLKADDQATAAPEQSTSTPKFDDLVSDEDKYGGIGGQLYAATSGFLNTALPVVGHKIDEAIGSNDSELEKGTREQNPISYGIGQVGGLLGSPVGKAIGAAGKGASALVGEGILGSAAKLATESALLQTTDETAKYMAKDPTQSLSSAAVDIGLASLLGGAFGTTGGILGKGVSKVADSKLGEFVSDFRNRILEHTAPEAVNVADKAASLKRALSGMYTAEDVGPQNVDPNNMWTFPIRGAKEEVPEISYKNLSPGAKAADNFIQSKLTGEGLAGMAGGALGHATGIPYAGLVTGGIAAKALGPALDTIIKPVLQGVLSAEGFEAASKFAGSVIKGEAAIANGAKAVFDRGLDVVPGKLVATGEDRDKIKEALKVAQERPESLLNVGGSLDHYMPSHNVALGQLTGNAVQYLTSLQPKPAGMGNPLDSKIQPSKAQETRFNRALDIAQQPLQVLQHVKDGTLLSDDLKTLMTLYPSLHQKLVQHLTNNMIDQQAKGQAIPYKVRSGLSLLMAQPMDKTFTPQAIQSTQALYAPKQPQQGGGQIKKGTKSLEKLSSQYQTAEQKREADRSTKS